MEQLSQLIRDIPDFPHEGIVFKDITPLLADPAALALAVELMANPYRKERVELVVGAESRGFIFGAAVAQALCAGFVPIRKPGKLPYETHQIEYGLEYGQDRVEIHTDALQPGQRVLLVDDLLATGGTMEACCKLIRQLQGEIVGATVLIELTALKGAEKLAPFTTVRAVLRY
ncbi:MAG: adenine phosphoribosyltransferase [Planctomycetota bacterium]|nr:MAG: adenine phosphoribosyltransferase [Planctomycetota bacterium]